MTGLAPPVPISAFYDSAIDAFSVTFDRALVAQAVPGGTLTFRSVFTRRRGTFMNALGAVVSGTSVVVGPDPGPNVVDYAPPPFGILGLVDSRPADPFADFPLVVV